MLTLYDQVLVVRAGQYDGTNAAELVTQFGAIVISEVAGVLTYADTGSGPFYTANIGDYIHWSGMGSVYTFVLSTLLAFPYVAVEVPLPPKALFTVTGTGAVAASLLGTTQHINVNLSGTMAAGYVPLIFLRGAPNILAGHSVLGHTIVDADTVQVHVQSGVASLAGGSVFVVAQELRSV